MLKIFWSMCENDHAEGRLLWSSYYWQVLLFHKLKKIKNGLGLNNCFHCNYYWYLVIQIMYKRKDETNADLKFKEKYHVFLLNSPDVNLNRCAIFHECEMMVFT